LGIIGSRAQVGVFLVRTGNHKPFHSGVEQSVI
jgi:hypothetical protein